MTNKEIVLAFYDKVFSAWDLGPVDQFMKPDYRQHSPEAKDGRDGFKEFAAGFFQGKPKFDIKNIAEDGDMVYVFFQCSFANGTAAKVCDIYRLEDGLLAEHWDVLQPIDPNDPGASGNGHF
ncbi:MAG: nuclear transport factor 2 family protein [Oscillospiraceae bacterium]|nr:nuclear transport factor 2 family protein [Oscillospiraceae bacterium]